MDIVIVASSKLVKLFHQAGFKNEFTTCSVVNTSAAMEGHEDELVKALTLLMYLGTVKHLSQELSSSLQVGLVASQSVLFTLLDHYHN